MSADETPPDAIRQLVDTVARQSTFADELRRWRVIGGHPDTLATLRIPGGYAFGAVRLVPLEWAERDQLYTGSMLASRWSCCREGTVVEVTEPEL